MIKKQQYSRIVGLVIQWDHKSHNTGIFPLNANVVLISDGCGCKQKQSAGSSRPPPTVLPTQPRLGSPAKADRLSWLARSLCGSWQDNSLFSAPGGTLNAARRSTLAHVLINISSDRLQGHQWRERTHIFTLASELLWNSCRLPQVERRGWQSHYIYVYWKLDFSIWFHSSSPQGFVFPHTTAAKTTKFGPSGEASLALRQSMKTISW